MKIYLLEKSNIVGKDKREWTKFTYLKVNGEVAVKLMKKSDFDKFEIGDESFVSSSLLESFLKQCPVSNADFDERGNVLNLS